MKTTAVVESLSYFKTNVLFKRIPTFFKIIAHEQNDNQDAHKLYLGNIETFRIGQVSYSVNDQWGNKVLFIIVHYRAVEIITEMYLCSKINDPKYQLHVFAG